ncbi:putative leucine-rich repeat-containing protein DDB_G0290503 isoform X4 [Prorops nasuta]|uniref:putative leucine-rich repeat-containing protein DDB_G0290503 isoform X4 n=1 Tax=Prorops nasuta TaxID=863751 RepID=UPI0034CE194C
MYSVDDSIDSSAAEQGNCCKGLTDEATGPTCQEKKGLQILREFTKLYEDKIRKAEEESDNESDKTSVGSKIILLIKLQIMTDWIQDLGEQNTMLVHVVEELEEAASSRVKLLSEKLQLSSDLAIKAHVKANHSEENIDLLLSQVNTLKAQKLHLTQEIEFLQSDIRGLLELIRRAQEDNCWNTEGIKFFAIQPSDIPVPVSCLCSQDIEGDKGKINSLEQEIQRLQNNETKALEKQEELKEKLAYMTKRVQNLGDALKKPFNQLRNNPDLSSIDPISHESQETIEALANEIAEKHDTVMQLKKENATLEKQCRHANMQTHFKDDIIKKLRKENKQAAFKDFPRRVRIDTSSCQERSVSCSNKACDFKDDKDISNSFHEQQDQIILYLTNTKLLMEKEKDALAKLKLEMDKVMGKGNDHQEIPYIYKKLEVIESLLKENMSKVSEHAELEENLNNFREVKLYLTERKTPIEIVDTIKKTISMIDQMNFEKEKGITIIDYVIKKFNTLCLAEEDNKDSMNMPSPNAIQQFKLMEEFRVCTVEAQAATEDIREEVDCVTCTMTNCQDKYTNLAKMVTDTYGYITATREVVMKVINKLDLYEKERNRYNERIENGSVKLKDVKNNFNRAQAELSRCINKILESSHETRSMDFQFSNANLCNDLLSLITDEIEQILKNLQVFQVQSCCTLSTLEELKNQLFIVDNILKNLHLNMDKTLLENELSQTTFCERMKRLEKLEGQVDCSQTKMQNVLEAFLSTKDQDSLVICTVDNQAEETIKTKEDLHKLRKKYNDLKMKTMQESCRTKFDEKINQWEIQITELQNQIKFLQNENKGKEDITVTLQNSIASMEKELNTVQNIAYNLKISHSADSTELKKQILELKTQIKAQNEVDVRRSKYFYSEGEDGSVKNGYCIKHENPLKFFDILQATITSAKDNLQEIETELKNMDNFEKHVLIGRIIKKLKKYEENINNCSEVIEDLRNFLCSKDELVENLNQVIKIQKNSISMTQIELKDVHQRLQQKISDQELVISQQTNEKKQLIKQNELQIQTIQHLQDAVVEAKRCLDQMGHKPVNEVNEIWPTSSAYSHGNVHDV